MTEPPLPRSYYDIPGWFWWLDRMIFAAILQSQEATPPGELVELGAYLGKSAVIIGDFVRDGERFVVVDLFGDTVGVDAANQSENRTSYDSLTRKEFERNYLALHDQLPEVVHAPSSAIVDHVEPGTARFIHIDASHLYEHVRADALAAKRLLRPGGVVVFDDYRAEHTPGVAAAVWEAVVDDGLIPVAVTPRKFYGAYSDDDALFETIAEMVDNDDRFERSVQEIRGRGVLRVQMAPEPEPEEPVIVAFSQRQPAGSGLVSKPGHGLRRQHEGRVKADDELVPSRRLVRHVARHYVPDPVTAWVVDRTRRSH